MRLLFFGATFFLSVLSGGRALAQDYENIKSDLFTCGPSKTEIPFLYHVGITEDGRLVSFSSPAESFGPNPIFYYPAKISMSKQGEKCVISVTEKFMLSPRVLI